MVPQLTGVWKGLGVFTRPGRSAVHAAQKCAHSQSRFAKVRHQYSRSPGHIVQLPKNIDDIENIELGIYNQPPTSHEDTNIIAGQRRQPSFQFLGEPVHFLL